MNRKREILIGQKFGDYEVIAAAPDRGLSIYWLCRCKCGAEREVYGGNLKSGGSLQCTSCGKRKHGMCGTGLYSYHTYLKKRNKLCDEWMDFATFFKAVGQRPKYHKLFALDDSNPIGPGNWEWSTFAEQRKRSAAGIEVPKMPSCYAIVLELRSKGLTLAEIGIALGISTQRVHQLQSNAINRVANMKQTIERYQASIDQLTAELSSLEASLRKTAQ